MIETYFSPSIDVLTRHCQACLNPTSRDATSKSQTPSDLLAEVISPVHDPVIITPSSSIKSELMRAFTQADKVTAGIEWQTRAGILKDVTDEKLSESLFSERVTWMILRVLIELRQTTPSEEWSLLKAYATDRSDRDLFALADRINRLLTAYATYRPEWLLQWAGLNDETDEIDPAIQSSPHLAWQSALVKRLTHDGLDLSVLKTLPKEIEALAQTSRWQRDIVVFMPFMISPLLEHFLKAVSEAGTHVRIYLLAPALDQTSDATPSRPYDQWHVNSLRLLERCKRIGSVTWLENDHRQEPNTMLQTFQQIVALTRPTVSHIPAYDESLTILRASSLQREVETFVDRLQTLFVKDPTLTPDDVMMLFPNIDQASSVVHAVLGRLKVEGKNQAPLLLPYVVTGETRDTDASLIHTLPGLLRLAFSRCTRRDLKAWLTEPAVMNELDLSLDDINILDTWFKSAGFVSGIHETHLQCVEQGDPHDDRTLERALERLGVYLMMGDIERCAVAPSTIATEGKEKPTWTGVTDAMALYEKIVRVSEALSKLAEIVFDENNTLLLRPIASDQSEVPTWLTTLMPILRSLFSKAAKAKPQSLLLPIETMLCAMGRDANISADVDYPVSCELLTQALDARLQKPTDATRLSDVITAGKVSQLYGIKKRIVGIFGLSRGCGFCEPSKLDEFDLRALSAKKLADRDGFSEDHHRFFSLFENCTDWLHLSYTGSTTMDGKDDPSALLSDVRAITGIEIINETVSPFLKHAFLTQDEDPKAPNRSWRSTDQKLATQLSEPLDHIAPTVEIPALTTFGQTREGDLDFRVVKNWFKKPAETLLKAMGIPFEQDEQKTLSVYAMKDDNSLSLHLLHQELFDYRKKNELKAIKALLAATPTLAVPSVRETLFEEEAEKIEALYQRAHACQADLAKDAICTTLKLTVPVSVGTYGQTTYECENVWLSNEKATLYHETVSTGKSNQAIAASKNLYNNILDLAILKVAIDHGTIEVIEPKEQAQKEEIYQRIESIRNNKSKGKYFLNFVTLTETFVKQIKSDPTYHDAFKIAFESLIALFDHSKSLPTRFYYSNRYQEATTRVLVGATCTLSDKPEELATKWLKSIVTVQKPDVKRQEAVEAITHWINEEQ